jgi:hypothetical protein
MITGIALGVGIKLGRGIFVETLMKGFDSSASSFST